MDKEKVLSFAEFVEAEEKAEEVVAVKLKTGTVYIGSITAEAFVEWQEQRAEGAEGRKKASALMIVRSLTDEKGTRIGDESQLSRLQKMSLHSSETLLKAIFKLNNINQPEATAKNG